MCGGRNFEMDRDGEVEQILVGLWIVLVPLLKPGEGPKELLKLVNPGVIIIRSRNFTAFLPF